MPALQARREEAAPCTRRQTGRGRKRYCEKRRRLVASPKRDPASAQARAADAQRQVTPGGRPAGMPSVDDFFCRTARGLRARPAGGTGVAGCSRLWQPQVKGWEMATDVGAAAGVGAVSEPARVAAADEAISAEELQLAARNHGLPLEALRFDVTPTGLHYLLIHYDIPVVDPAGFRLTIGGLVDTPLSLDLAAIRRRPRRPLLVTLECAGNGRARLLPRPVSQPWLVEAVGTAGWTGTPLAALLREAGLRDGAVEVVFTGADHGIERGVEQDYQRSLPVAECLREDVLLAYEMNDQPLPPQHGFPLRLVVPGWYGMAHVKWLTGITRGRQPFDGFQMRRLPAAAAAGREGDSADPHRAAGAARCRPDSRTSCRAGGCCDPAGR